MNPSNPKQPIQCPLCGHRFVPEAGRCASCPLAGQGCERICCPNCLYSFPAESKLVSWFRKLREPKSGDRPKESKS